MGKNLIQQRRGRGTTTYRAHSFRWKGKASHRMYDETERTSNIRGTVIDLIHCPGHSAPLAKIKYDNNETILEIAPNSIKVSDVVFSGNSAPINSGCTLPLKNIPEGTAIYNIESAPGDGGKFCRSAGSEAKIVSIMPSKVTIVLPSRKKKDFNPECRATIGSIAGSGRQEKPFLKAGPVHHLMRARGKLYPLTSAVAMNAVDHPFGCGRGRHVGKPKNAPRFAPSGRNVGKIHARRTGKPR